MRVVDAKRQGSACLDPRCPEVAPGVGFEQVLAEATSKLRAVGRMPSPDQALCATPGGIPSPAASTWCKATWRSLRCGET